MGTQWLNEAFAAPNLTPSQKSVLVAMADHASNENAICFPSIGRLELYTSLSRRTIFRVINDLMKLGHVTKLAPQTRGNSTYRLHFPKPEGVSPCHPPSDTVTPGGVTQWHSTGDTVTPEPSVTVIEPSLKSAPSRGKDRDNVRRAPEDDSPVLGADPQNEDSGDGWPRMRSGTKELTPGSAPYFVEYFSWKWGRSQGRCIWKSADPLRGYFSRLNREGYSRDEVRQMIDSFCADPKHYIGRRRPSSENPPGTMFIGASLKLLEEIRRSSPSRREDEGPGDRNLERMQRLLGA